MSNHELYQNNESSAAGSALNLSAKAALWASAFVLAGLVLLQAGRLNVANTARAEMAVDGSDFALITTQGGNEELIYVLEKRTGRVIAYEAGPANQGYVRALDAEDVGALIERLQARGRGGGN